MKIKDQAAAAISALHSLSRRQAYQDLLPQAPGISDAPAPNESVLMAYDFHTTSAGDCFLVEINTNAAGFLFTALMEMTHKNLDATAYPPLAQLRQSFEQEVISAGKSPQSMSVAITDENVFEQKMVAEFFMYRDWFQQLGWNCEICESSDFSLSDGRLSAPGGLKPDLIYNRSTDFYFSEPQHETLKNAFSQQLCVFSPNPKEYWRLADKQRLIQLGQKDFLEQAQVTEAEKGAVQTVLLPTHDKTDFSDEDEIWDRRKSLFFKPKRSYGGKSVYRGESVSRKVFERLMSEDTLIQQYQPAQAMPSLDASDTLSNWKFDLRFYVYGAQIQLCVARAYQGQVTNFSSPYGGFTLVQF